MTKIHHESERKFREMTKPTQAQIVDAIALKIFNASLPALTLEESRVIAEHAVTAAADVGPEKNTPMTTTKEQIGAWRDVITQAMACIRGETPEDISFGEAEDDTFSKLRRVDAEMSAALTAAADVGGKATEATNEMVSEVMDILRKAIWGRWRRRRPSGEEWSIDGTAKSATASSP